MDNQTGITERIESLYKAMLERLNEQSEQSKRESAEHEQKTLERKRLLISGIAKIVGEMYEPYIDFDTDEYGNGRVIRLVLSLPGCTEIRFKALLDESDQPRVYTGYEFVGAVTSDGIEPDDTTTSLDMAVGMSRRSFLSTSKGRQSMIVAPQEKRNEDALHCDGKVYYVKNSYGEYIFPVQATVVHREGTQGVIVLSCQDVTTSVITDKTVDDVYGNMY